jgi:hypothetical protein
LLALALPVWNSGQNNAAEKSTPVAAPKTTTNSTNLQIQSAALRIEFDHNLRSRVVGWLAEARNS